MCDTLMEDKILKSFIKYAKKDKIVGLHISYYNNGNFNQFNYGHTNKNETELVNNKTLFEIGSITKPIIATIYSILQGNKIIDIERPVSYYFRTNSVHPIFESITVKNILTHTSGLPRIPDIFLNKMDNKQDPYSCLRIEDLYQFLKTPSNLNKNGKYNYSNLGYGILGEILRITTSKSIQEISNEVLFDKLNMSSTNVVTNLENRGNVAQGYNFIDEETSYWHNEVLAGAGCFLSCGDDMIKYLVENVNSRCTTFNESIHNTHFPFTKSVGLAWHFKNSFFSKILGYSGYIWHNGMTGGFSSFICFHKKKKVGLVLLANKAMPLDSYFYNFSSYF